MKALILALAIGLVAINAQALTVAFERNYTNHAWGYQHTGCFIDAQRYVYVYDFTSGEPIRQVGQMNASAFTKAQQMLAQVSEAPYDGDMVAVDAGSTVWTGTLRGEVIRIREGGNYRGGRASAATDALVELIEAFCPRY